MTESEFKSQMHRAETLRRTTNDRAEGSYWDGYIRGLRRAYHGERFGTEDEHQLFLDAVHSRDVARRRMGEGYADGLALGGEIPPVSEFVRLRHAAGHTQASLAEVMGWSVGWIRNIEQGRTDVPPYAILAMRQLAGQP